MRHLPSGLFENVTQGVWSSATETKGGRTATHNASGVTVSGPTGSINFFAAGTQVVRHKFFGTDNFLAILTSETTNPGNHSMNIVDFTAPALTSKNVMLSRGTGLPWLQHSLGNGVVCLIGAPTAFGVAGLNILRSDNGNTICPGPPPFVPVQQIIGETIAGPPLKVQIKEGGVVKAGPCPLPGRQAHAVAPANPTTFTTVKIGGCAQPPSTKQFTLKNTGDDLLTINSVGSAAHTA